MNLSKISISLAALCTAFAAQAADPKLAIVYDSGGKFDKSFNQSASEGAERFKKDTKISYMEVQVGEEAQTEQALRNLARKNVDLIAAIGFAQAQAVQTVAKEFPKTKFVIIDGVANGDNISSVLFKEQEGSYLVPAKGGELARAQFERGVDVVFAAAGGSGMGTLQAAKEKGKLAIGVDSNQNYLHPGVMLTSMLKRVDNAIYDSFMQVKNGNWQAGIVNKGLKEGGVDWALDKDNRALITPDMEKRINAAKHDIVSGKVKVVDYRASNSCPV